MERELFAMVRRMLRRLGRRRRSRKQRYTDATILEVYIWAVLHDRPTVWACDPANWLRGVRRGALPSQSVMSRRLRSRAVASLADRLEELVLRRGRPAPVACIVDGKPLPIANHSRDRQAGYGWGAGRHAKGYKLHAVIDTACRLWRWRVTPMNSQEGEIARRLLRDQASEGYLLADAGYDSNGLFAFAAERGIQLIAPRRYGPSRGMGHRVQHPARLRSRDLLENGVSRFGSVLLEARRSIERFFGTLVCTGGGLSGLPAWVRTHRRVRQWVQAKLVLNQLRADLRTPRPKPHHSA